MLMIREEGVDAALAPLLPRPPQVAVPGPGLSLVHRSTGGGSLLGLLDLLPPPDSAEEDGPPPRGAAELHLGGKLLQRVQLEGETRPLLPLALPLDMGQALALSAPSPALSIRLRSQVPAQYIGRELWVELDGSPGQLDMALQETGGGRDRARLADWVLDLSHKGALACSIGDPRPVAGALGAILGAALLEAASGGDFAWIGIPGASGTGPLRVRSDVQLPLAIRLVPGRDISLTLLAWAPLVPTPLAASTGGDSGWQQKLGPALLDRIQQAGPDERIPVALGIDGLLGSDRRAALEAAGATIRTVLGDVVTAGLAVRALPAVAALDFILRVEGGQTLQPERRIDDITE